MIAIASTTTRYELINGRKIEKPLPKKLHFFIQRYLVLALSRMLRSQHIAGAELSILTGGRSPDGRREYVVPDVVIMDRHVKYEDGDLAQPPSLAIEILSPKFA
jgi:Uma2 family endonuclease